MSFAEMAMSVTFAPQTLRIRFESSEGSMMVDLSTIASMELIQNLQNTKSRNSLFGLTKETLTRMGERTLRRNILQPSTDASTINERYDAVSELCVKREMFAATQDGKQTSTGPNADTQNAQLWAFWSTQIDACLR
jgi:DNA mismatch repair protein MSH4